MMELAPLRSRLIDKYRGSNRGEMKIFFGFARKKIVARPQETLNSSRTSFTLPDSFIDSLHFRPLAHSGPNYAKRFGADPVDKENEKSSGKLTVRS
jgi:hypothetical protein